jgi:DNA-binding Xre family transcriptional regulator
MEQKRYKLTWKLHTVMSDRGIRTSTELHRRLEPYGINITSHQLSRIVSILPARLNTEVLNALMTELQCSAADLIQQVEVPSEAMAAANIPDAPQRKRKTPKVAVPKAPTSPPAPLEPPPPTVTGPNVVALPKRPPSK